MGSGGGGMTTTDNVLWRPKELNGDNLSISAERVLKKHFALFPTLFKQQRLEKYPNIVILKMYHRP